MSRERGLPQDSLHWWQCADMGYSKTSLSGQGSTHCSDLLVRGLDSFSIFTCLYCQSVLRSICLSFWPIPCSLSGTDTPRELDGYISLTWGLHCYTWGAGFSVLIFLKAVWGFLGSPSLRSCYWPPELVSSYSSQQGKKNSFVLINFSCICCYAGCFPAVLCGLVWFFCSEGYMPDKGVAGLLSHSELYKDCRTIPAC